MCRWLAYSGTPILLDSILYKPVHSLIDQSLHAKMGVETTNGDGFGVGWYGEDTDSPAVPLVATSVKPFDRSECKHSRVLFSFWL